jgi:probable biosynthetic protein (TIGR04099 family)
MNTALDQRDRLQRSVTLGMPQLCARGLSESWLLKEAGDLHWQALARAHGQRPGDLRDAAGRRLYAAFTQVHLRQARLDAAHEDEPLAGTARWRPVGRSQAYTLQRWQGPRGLVAELEMLSVFIARTREGDNRSVVRSALAHPPPQGLEPSLAPLAQASHDAARAARAGAWAARFEPPPETLEWRCRPCPLTDFNGAGLLYFASFQALADRALWDWGLSPDGHHTLERQLVFHGNVNPGETVRVRWHGQARAGRGRWTWLQVSAEADGRALADIATWQG